MEKTKHTADVFFAFLHCFCSMKILLCSPKPFLNLKSISTGFYLMCKEKLFSCFVWKIFSILHFLCYCLKFYLCLWTYNFTFLVLKTVKVSETHTKIIKNVKTDFTLQKQLNWPFANFIAKQFSRACFFFFFLLLKTPHETEAFFLSLYILWTFLRPFSRFVCFLTALCCVVVSALSLGSFKKSHV